MNLALIALAGSTAVAAAVLWLPLPAPVATADGLAPPVAPATPASRIVASPAAALVAFAPPAEDAAAPPPRAPPVLVGLIGGQGRRIAYVLWGDETLRAGLGDKVGPWRVAAIGAHDIRLAGGGKPMTLAFYGPRAAPPTPIAAAMTPDANAGATPAAPLAAPPVHAIEPASAPSPPSAPRGGRPRYWVGPPGSAPPGYILLKPGELPPR